MQIEDQPSFWLPEYKVRFHCGNGAGIVFNGNTTVHCTTSSKPTGVLGIAFVQKRPFIVQLSKALKNPKEKLALSYFKARDHYITRRVRYLSELGLLQHFILYNFSIIQFK